MSVLGYVSGQIEREQQQLAVINRAVLALRAEALGVGDALQLDRVAVKESRGRLQTFLAQLTATLAGGTADVPMGTLIEILTSRRSREDWIEDLRGAQHALASVEQLTPQHLGALTEIVQALDREFAGTLHRLYGRQ
jgi:hypothetical protein